jgi:hypothetical protein
MSRKTLYDISWQVSEEEYRADKAYSYSTIAKFNREGFDNLDKLFDKVDTPSLLFGSMVDTLLTDGQEEFDNKYEVAEFPNISDTLIQVAKELFNYCSESYRTIEDIPDNIISAVGEKCGYYANAKYSQYRVKKIKEECSDYYNLLFISTDKTLVSQEEYQLAQDCVNILKTNKDTKWYFEDNNPFNTTIERLYQLKFKGEYEGIQLRCMADLIIVDHENKVIIPCDLKTSSKPEWRFYKSFIDWNYWIQAQLYWYIIRQNLDKDDIYKDYKLLNYRFIVINKRTKKPLVWEYNDTQVITDCTYGKNDQYLCKNWRNIVKELHYYMTCNSEFPIGIKDINNVKEWLNKE